MSQDSDVWTEDYTDEALELAAEATMINLAAPSKDQDSVC